MKKFAFCLIVFALAAFCYGSALSDARGPDKIALAKPSVLKDKFTVKKFDAAEVSYSAVLSSNTPDIASVQISNQKRPPALVKTFRFKN